jgi:hypothetical protein
VRGLSRISDLYRYGSTRVLADTSSQEPTIYPRAAEHFLLRIWVSLPTASALQLMLDRDGTMDIIFPTCAQHSSSAGTGSDCALNIAYNKQVPICSGISSENVTLGLEDAQSLKCRGWAELCVGDENFNFTFDTANEVGLPAGLKEDWLIGSTSPRSHSPLSSLLLL